MSLLESLPLIMVLASLIGFLLGLWGMAHKHILHSISARNYTFETFNHRANLTYFNDVRSVNHSYEQSNMRFHMVGDGEGGGLKALTTVMRFPANSSPQAESDEFHRSRIWNDPTMQAAQETQLGTEVPWVMVGYGMCLNAACGE